MTWNEDPLTAPKSPNLLSAALALLAAVSVVLPLLTQSPGALPDNLADHGTFEIFDGGKSIGTETFEIRLHSNQIEAQGEVHLELEQNGKKVEARTISNLVLDSDFHPLTYTWSQKGTQSSQLSINFRVQPAQVRYKTVGGKEDRRDFSLDKDVTVLDDNVVHHYQLALARYDQTKGGTQSFHAFIPQEAAPGVITLKAIGTEPVTIDGESRTLRHFLLATDLAQINLWADDHGHIQMVSVPVSQYQAIRKK